MKTLIDIRNGNGHVDDIDHLGNRRVRSVGEMAENAFRIGLVRVERAVKERLTIAESEPIMPQEMINAKPVAAAVKEFFGSSQLSQIHGPEQSAVGSDPQAPRLGAGARRPHARARGFRGARRASDALRPRVPDRDAGRPEHRPDQFARGVRAHERLRLPGNAVSARRERQGDRQDRLPVRDRRRPVRDRAGERVAQREGRVHRGFDLLPHAERVHALGARQDRLHGRQSEADRLGGGVADPVPRARRREPRVDGLEHAAPGGADAALRNAAGRNRHGTRGRDRLGRHRGRAPRRQRRFGRCLAHRRARQ